MDEAWNNFMITGRVTDYLKYKESHEGSFDTTGRGWENRPDGSGRNEGKAHSAV